MTKSNLKFLLGNKIKIIRLSLGLTQEELAEKIGLERNSISKIETGKRFPSYKTIEKLVYCFNIKYSDLFSFDKNEVYADYSKLIISELLGLDAYKQNFILNFIRFYKKQ